MPSARYLICSPVRPSHRPRRRYQCRISLISQPASVAHQAVQEHHPPGSLGDRIAVRVRVGDIQITGYRVAGGLVMSESSTGADRCFESCRVARCGYSYRPSPDGRFESGEWKRGFPKGGGSPGPGCAAGRESPESFRPRRDPQQGIQSRWDEKGSGLSIAPATLDHERRLEARCRLGDRSQ